MVQYLHRTGRAFDKSQPNYQDEIDRMHGFLWYHIATTREVSKYLEIPEERVMRYKALLEKLRYLVVVEDEQYIFHEGEDHLSCDPYLVEEILISNGLSPEPEDWPYAA